MDKVRIRCLSTRPATSPPKDERAMRFHKCQALGNDYIVVKDAAAAVLTPELLEGALGGEKQAHYGSNGQEENAA